MFAAAAMCAAARAQIPAMRIGLAKTASDSNASSQPTSASSQAGSASSQPVSESTQPDDSSASTESKGAATAPKDGAAPKLSKEETEALKAQYDALAKARQDEMKAYYKDLGLDLDKVLGLASAASAKADRIAKLVQALQGLDFARTPPNVLAARAKIGFGQVPHPDPNTADAADLAKWIHLQVMAGEWGKFTDYLAGRSRDESQPIYTKILQSLNTANSGLLPEEVLAVAEACPEEPKTWQTTAWAAMLKVAVEKNSPGSMLEKIRAGTRFFGAADAVKRRRTVDLLAGAGLLTQAYSYLPPLEEARTAGDGDLILVHGLYMSNLAAHSEGGPVSDGHRAQAWKLFCEASLAKNGSLETKREAIRQAIALMSHMPRSQVTPWLQRVYADDALGPAALESIALSAVAIGKPGAAGQDEERAQSILTLKEAVDVLLERKGLDESALRVPMRMLTTALVAEMETAVAQKGRERVTTKQAQLLLRAVPSKAWLDALESSLAARTEKACISIATTADETDMALALLADAVKRTPDEAIPIANAFLAQWELRLSPKKDIDDDTMIYYFWREYVTQAPLTRGRQRRNLERLGQLMKTLEAIGVDPRSLTGIAPAFKACHGITEVYDRSDIERVFGPFDRIPANTAATLAQTMAASLNGDWRNRATQVQAGVKRTDSEIARLVDKGYGIAIELIDHALTQEPESWRYAVVKAGLSYDRLQFRKSQKISDDAAKEADYQAAAFAAFEQAAQRYARAIAAGQEREDINVYARWFGAAMGTSQLNFLNADDLPAEGTLQDDQIERIKKSIAALPGDAAFRHISDFAQAIGGAVARTDPEVKPRLVKHALRIVGDHPAGASLRGLNELYRDLVKDEIKLRLAIDGEDRVGTNRPFGLLVSLRFTNSVDRETGGFSKYLQTSAYVRVGRRYQEVNFREKLQKNIETTLAKGFSVESIGFFDPFMPADGVVENGTDGWLEKPMAYVIVRRTDPTVDRIPQLTMDMQFEDQTGPVSLVLPSNTPPIAVESTTGETESVRPCSELEVTQVVDGRDARDDQKDRTIKLEVLCRGKGAVPELNQILVGLENAIDGYRIEDKGIECKPTVVMQEGGAVTQRFYFGPPKPPEGGYPKRDDTGMYRLPIERSWLVTYTPTAGPLGKEFRLPRLAEGMNAKLTSRYFSDLDLVPAVDVVSIERRSLFWPITAAIGLVLLIIGGVTAYRRRSSSATQIPAGIPLPDRVTPLSAVMMLKRIAVEHDGLDERCRGELDRDIEMIHQKYFGPGSAELRDGELIEVLKRWSAEARRFSIAHHEGPALRT